LWSLSVSLIDVVIYCEIGEVKKTI
jgi:hypothetical protein